MRKFLLWLQLMLPGCPARVVPGLLPGLLLAANMPAPAAPAPAQASVAAPAPRPAARPLPLPPDRSTALPPRRADATRLRELADQREFRYLEPDASTDAWDAFWARLWHWLGGLTSTSAGRLTWQYGVYAVVLAALVYTVLKLMRVDITDAFGRAGRRSTLAYDTATENIHEVDFPARIAAAEDAGNLRLATRLGYLEVLKRLTDQGLINWQPDKTNHAYLAELVPGTLAEAFGNATREFEYVWYGELRLSARLYQQTRASQRAVVAPLPGGNRPAALAPVASSHALPA